jgi:hypothetical protein
LAYASVLELVEHQRVLLELIQELACASVQELAEHQHVLLELIQELAYASVLELAEHQRVLQEQGELGVQAYVRVILTFYILL